MTAPKGEGRKAQALMLYLGACLLVALAPGPDNCFVLAQSAGLGVAAGLWVTAGLVTGLCVHISLAVLGVAALLNRCPRLADGVAMLGALYLFYVAWGMWGAAFGTAPTEHRSMLGFYLRGIVLNLSNPKVILFFVAFLPRCAVEDELRDGRLIELDTEIEGGTVRAMLSYHKNKWMSPAMRLFIELVKKSFRTEPQ